jgi:hypothetical protein
MANPSFSLLIGDPTTWGVPPVGKTFLGINLSGVLTIVNNNGSGGAIITPVVSAAPQQVTLGNAAGTTTITSVSGVFTATVVVSGTPRAVPLVLATAGMTDGMTIDLLVIFPATDGFVLNLYNTIGSGGTLDSFSAATASPLVTTGHWKLLFTSSTGLWSILENQFPAIQS